MIEIFLLFLCEFDHDRISQFLSDRISLNNITTILRQVITAKKSNN